MKHSFKFAALVLLLALVCLPARPVAASDGHFDGQVVFGQSFTLASGDTLTGDLLVFGGSAEIQEDARVNGNIVLFGGDLVVNGEVSGDVSATGATVTLGPTAHVGGDLVTVGATLNRAETALVDGQVFNTATSWSDGTTSEPLVTPVPPIIPDPEPILPDTVVHFNPFSYIWNVFSNAIGLGLLAMLLMLFLAPHAGRVSQAVISQPLTAGGLGLLVVLLTPLTLLLMILTLILIPVAGLVVVALFAAGVFGWMALGLEIGQRFSRAIHQTWHPSFEAGLGTFALTLVASALTDLPILQCIGWFVPFLLGLTALGAVIITRFGTRALAPRATPQAVQPEVEPIFPVPAPEEPKRRKKAGQ